MLADLKRFTGPPLLARFRGLRGPYVDKLITHDIARTPNDCPGFFRVVVSRPATFWPLLGRFYVMLWSQS